MHLAENCWLACFAYFLFGGEKNGFGTRLDVDPFARVDGHPPFLIPACSAVCAIFPAAPQELPVSSDLHLVSLDGNIAMTDTNIGIGIDSYQ